MRVGAAIVMVVLGWALARDLGRFTAPALFRRMDPATAGTVGFLIRLVFIVAAALFALRVAGLQPATLAVGGAITAVVFGLAAQQTLGNLIAGMVLISARPFKVGDRVRLQAGGLAGQIEGVVASLGLLYTTFAQDRDSVDGAQQRRADRRDRAAARARPRSTCARGCGPTSSRATSRRCWRRRVRTPVRSEPHISLEEVDRDEVIVRIAATPVAESDGPQLADEVLAAIGAVTRPEDDDDDRRSTACRTSAARQRYEG